MKNLTEYIKFLLSRLCRLNLPFQTTISIEMSNNRQINPFVIFYKYVNSPGRAA